MRWHDGLLTGSAFSCYWLKAKNAQGFGDGIPKNSGLVVLGDVDADVLAVDIQVIAAESARGDL